MIYEMLELQCYSAKFFIFAIVCDHSTCTKRNINTYIKHKSNFKFLIFHKFFKKFTSK